MNAVVYQGDAPPAINGGNVDLYLKPGDNLRTGEEDFRERFGEPTTLERDLLLVAASVFAVDLVAKRGLREDVTRDIRLTVPVVNYHAFEGQRVALERLLHFLSHDNWTISFRSIDGQAEAFSPPRTPKGKALLFSGGLDSFAASVDLIDEVGPENVVLASHTTGNTFTIRSQQQIHEYLKEHYSVAVDRVSIRTGGKSSDELEFTDDPEISQRTRSFTFLTIATLAARRRGMTEVVMIAENGQMAIHLPLSAGRIGAFSTHTAHPKFVAEASRFFTAILRHDIEIVNPFLYATKAEVIRKIATNHSTAIPFSTSCWKTSRIGGEHCGACVPCYVRRIALEYDGVDGSTWKRDIFREDVSALPSEDEGKRNLADVALFAANFAAMTDTDLLLTYCELYSPDFDRDAAIAMYRRFANEARTVMSRYPTLAAFL